MIHLTRRQKWVAFAALVITATLRLNATNPVQSTPSAAMGTVRSPAIEAAPLPQHPRLFFSSQDISTLRTQAGTTHQQIWQPVLAFARSQLNSVPAAAPLCTDLEAYRSAGNQMVAFAFAYVITGDSAYLDLTRRYLLAYAQWRYWGDEGGCGTIDLGFHHMLVGSAIAYDWVYNDLSDADRATIRASLAGRAEESFEASAASIDQWGNWWRRAYTQNHNWVNHSALGMAALALEGEDARAQSWLDEATENMARVSHLLEGIADGSWHEGIPYQTYGLTMALPFLYNLRGIKGRDLIPHTYLRNYVYWRIYNSLPNSSRFALSYADFDWSWGNAYCPQGILRFEAREHRDGHGEWMAQQITANDNRRSNVYTVPWYVFEFLYYDPTVGPQSPDDLPSSRTFPDLEGVLWRTGWGSDDLVFGLKTGAPGGRFAFDQFTSGEHYPFDPNDGGDMINASHDHADANTFYIYRGSIDLASEVPGAGVVDTGNHNTLLVDGQGQRTPDYSTNPADFRGTDGRLEIVGETRDFNYLIADATRQYTSLEEFRRYVLFVKPGYLVMVDNVWANAPHEYDWVSHFDSSVSIEGDWIKGFAANTQIMGVKVVEPHGFEATSGNDGKPYVRIQSPSPVANTQFVTVLYPTDEANWESRPPISQLESNDQAVALRVLLNGTEDHLIKYGAQRLVAVGGYSFDGVVASVVTDAGGSLRRVFLGQGSQLSDRGGSRSLIEGAGQMLTVQADYAGDALSIFGEKVDEVRIYAPGVDVNQVTVNGWPVVAARDGDYVVLPRQQPSVNPSAAGDMPLAGRRP